MNVHVSISQLSNQEVSNKKNAPHQLRNLGGQDLQFGRTRASKTPLSSNYKVKVKEPTHHVPKILIRSFISFYVVLQYGRLERLNSIDVEIEHTLMKRIISAIIGYLGAKRTVQRATAVFCWRFFNFQFQLIDTQKQSPPCPSFSTAQIEVI